MQDQRFPEEKGSGWSPARIVLWCFLAIAAFFLLTEHTAHVFGVLPFLLLLACPFMHLFMHGKHDGHEAEGEDHADHRDHSAHSSEGGQ